MERLVHNPEGGLEPFKYPSRLAKIQIEDQDAILRLYDYTLSRVDPHRREEFERTLLLFYRRVKKHGVGVWKHPHLGVNNRYWRGVVWKKWG